MSHEEAMSTYPCRAQLRPQPMAGIIHQTGDDDPPAIAPSSLKPPIVEQRPVIPAVPCLSAHRVSEHNKMADLGH